MTNLLELIFIELTESGTDKKISVRADLIAVLKETTRGTVEVFLKDIRLADMMSISVSDTREEIIEVLHKAYVQLSKNAKENL